MLAGSSVKMRIGDAGSAEESAAAKVARGSSRIGGWNSEAR